MNFVFIKRFLIVVASLFIWFIIHTTFVIIDGLNDELKPVDAAVVLGNKVEVNGQPSDRLKARLDTSVELYDGGYFTFIIVSGGWIVNTKLNNFYKGTLLASTGVR